MLHGLLLILKIIGWLVLGILCLLLGLILIVLFVPVRYRMEGSWHGALKGTARITWLLHILSVKVSYDENGELLTSFRLLGFRLLKDRADGEEVLEEGLDDLEQAGRSAARTVEESGAQEEGISPGDRAVQEDPLIKQNLDSGEDVMDPDEAMDDDSDMILQTQNLGGDGEEALPEYGADESKKKEGRIPRFFKNPARRCAHFLEKIKFLFHTLCDKLKHIKEKYEAVLTFLKDEENQKTMKLIFRQVKALLRHILPRKASGYVAFGFDDPYFTGQVLAVASLFYAWYGQKIDLIPMFEEPILEGELKLKGRLRMGTLLWYGLRVCLNKNFRKLLKRWRNQGGIF